MKKIVIVILILVIISGCREANNSEINSMAGAKKVILKIAGQEEFFYWELKDERSIWGFELGEVQALSKYKDSLELELGHQKYALAVKKESLQNLEKSLIGKEEDGDRINALLVHTGSVGMIRKINYLEAQILNYQIKRFPMFSKPTEFHGFITRNEEEKKIRIYFASSDKEWPPKPNLIIEELESQKKIGWELIGHLHNHFCKRDNDYIGILAPSLADAQYYKMLKERFKLERAIITNGFHTVEIENKDFAKFESH